VEGHLLIADCHSLKMQLLPQGQLPMQELEALEVRNCSQLPSLEGLRELKSAGSVNLQDLASLTDLSGLSSLIQVRTLTIQACNHLVDLHGLNAFKGALESITIGNNAQLRTLDGVEGLEYTPMLKVENNPMLHNISALRSIRDVTTRTFTSNSALCCPSFAFFDETKFLVTDLNCNLCLNFGAVTPSVLPYSGGVSPTPVSHPTTPFALGCARLQTVQSLRLHASWSNPRVRGSCAASCPRWWTWR
jgi:hypothetical protein